ncbi:hypothetical protein SUGI_0666850 [Cryptomeria japonica]|nr:hypothetical protein SUGI_0666850 [Cryptomeria japonica]
MVIITTRDQSVLRGADIRYKMKGMDKDHAMELFCKHDFRGRDPPAAYKKEIPEVERGVRVVDYMPIKDKAISIWKASGWSVEHAVQTLQDKYLVEVTFLNLWKQKDLNKS